MGEIAEMMLDGTLCACCGCYLTDKPDGFPIRCEDCVRNSAAVRPATKAKGGLQKQVKVKCECGRWIAPRGMQKHIHDFHKRPGAEE